jgi:hypothetical protein
MSEAPINAYAHDSSQQYSTWMAVRKRRRISPSLRSFQ